MMLQTGLPALSLPDTRTIKFNHHTPSLPPVSHVSPATQTLRKKHRTLVPGPSAPIYASASAPRPTPRPQPAACWVFPTQQETSCLSQDISTPRLATTPAGQARACRHTCKCCQQRRAGNLAQVSFTLQTRPVLLWLALVHVYRECCCGCVAVKL